MIIVGLDFSLNFPAFCIRFDNNAYKWLTFTPEQPGLKTEKYYWQQKIINETEVNIYYWHIAGQRKGKADYDWLNLRKYWSLQVIQQIKNTIGEEQPGADFWLSIENSSYSKKTNNILDIESAITVLKSNLIEDNNCKGWDLWSPAEVKNKIGSKGNAGKFDILEKFINNENESIKKSNFYQFVCQNPIKDEKQLKKMKPIDDCIDSFILTQFY